MHKPTGMVIFHNTVAHPFPAWYIFRAFDIIGMIGNRPQKNNTRIFIDCIIRYTISPNVISLFQMLMCGKVTHKSLIGSSPLFRKIFERTKTISLHGLRDGTIILVGGGHSWPMKIKKTLTQC